MRVELYHDILARKVFEKASVEEKARLKIERFVRERYRYFKENQELLTKKELDYITPYLGKLELEPVYREFISASQEDIKRKRKRRQLTVLGILTVLLFSLVLSLLALRNAGIEKKRQQALLWATQSKLAMDRGEVSYAFRLAQAAFTNSGDGSIPCRMAEEVFRELYSSGLYCDFVHQDSIVAIDVSPDEKYILTASQDGMVKAWGADCQPMAEYCHNGPVTSLSVAPGFEQTLLLSSGADHLVVLYDYLQGEELWRHEDTVSITTALFSPDGRFFAFGNQNGLVQLYRTDSPERVIDTIQWNGPAVSIDFSSTQFFLVAGRNAIQSFALAGSGIRNAYPRFTSPVGELQGARFLFEATILSTGAKGMWLNNYDGTALELPYQAVNEQYFKHGKARSIWVKEGGPIPHHILAYIQNEDEIEVRYAHFYPFFQPMFTLEYTAPVTHYCLSRNGDLILSATEDGRFELRDAKDGRLRLKARGTVEKARFFFFFKGLVSTSKNIGHLWRIPAARDEMNQMNPKKIEAILDTALSRFPDSLLSRALSF